MDEIYMIERFVACVVGINRRLFCRSTIDSFADQPSARSRQERELERCEHREQWRMDETGVCAAKNAQPFLVFHCYKKNLQTQP
jgi:hypothetical protein